jgi:hypothetical protein
MNSSSIRADSAAEKEGSRTLLRFFSLLHEPTRYSVARVRVSPESHSPIIDSHVQRGIPKLTRTHTNKVASRYTDRQGMSALFDGLTDGKTAPPPPSPSGTDCLSTGLEALTRIHHVRNRASERHHPADARPALRPTPRPYPPPPPPLSLSLSAVHSSLQQPDRTRTAYATAIEHLVRMGCCVLLSSMQRTSAHGRLWAWYLPPVLHPTCTSLWAASTNKQTAHMYIPQAHGGVWARGGIRPPVRHRQRQPLLQPPKLPRPQRRISTAPPPPRPRCHRRGRQAPGRPAVSESLQ